MHVGILQIRGVSGLQLATAGDASTRDEKVARSDERDGRPALRVAVEVTTKGLELAIGVVLGNVALSCAHKAQGAVRPAIAVELQRGPRLEESLFGPDTDAGASSAGEEDVDPIGHARRRFPKGRIVGILLVVAAR